MAIRVFRRTGENNDHLVQRFKKMVKGARYIMEIKKHRRFEKDLTKRKVRDKAVMREYYRDKRKREILAS